MLALLALGLLEARVKLLLLLKSSLLDLYKSLYELRYVLTLEGHREATIELTLIVCISKHVTEGRDE